MPNTGKRRPAPLARLRLRPIAPVALVMLAAAWLVATAWSGRSEAAPASFELAFEHPGAGLEDALWRFDARLRRTTPARSETFDRWRLAGPPDVSFDGRQVLFAGREPSAATAGLWEMNVDGGGARRLVACERGCASPRYLPDGRIVFAAPVGQSGAGVDALFTIRRDGSGLDRITYGRGRDRALGVLPDGRISFRRRPPESNGGGTGMPLWLTVQPDGTGMTRATTAPGTAGRVVPTRGDGPAPGITAALAVPRPVPPVATTIVDASRRTGRLLGLDLWLTTREGRPFRRPETGGYLRVIDGESDLVLGEAPVAPDGSFYVEVPADRLLRLQALDAAREVVATLESGIWVRPNEHRGCIGCHEPPSLSPENRFPQALRAPLAVAVGPTAGGDAAQGSMDAGHE